MHTAVTGMRKSAAACGFCCFQQLRARNQIVYEDALVLGMVDHNPRAKTHLLVIPQQHIPYVDDLTASHHDLLRHMLDTGKRLMIQDGYSDDLKDCQFGFHRPPFASVPHLHLHCLGMPFRPSWNRIRYTESILGSYVDASRVLASLRSAESDKASESDGDS